MKLKFFVKIAEWILGREYSDDEPRADMYLPMWILAFGLILLLGGAGMGVYMAIADFSAGLAVAAVICILLGCFAVMCWKNQTIRMLPNDSFEYSTMFGNKKVYRFRDIKGLRQNSDSMTLFVGDSKVHIENAAIISKRLAERLDQVFDTPNS